MYIHNCNRIQAAPAKPSDRTFKLDILNLRKSKILVQMLFAVTLHTIQSNICMVRVIFFENFKNIP
jgi:hypothetical protein